MQPPVPNVPFHQLCPEHLLESAYLLTFRQHFFSFLFLLFFWLGHKKFFHFYYSQFSPVMTNPPLCRAMSHKPL